MGERSHHRGRAISSGAANPGDVVERWVADRRNGWSIASIAGRDGVLGKDVARVTQPHSPFPRGHAVKGPEAPLGILALSRLFGVADPTVWRWYRHGRLPEPDNFTPAGRPPWKPTTIQEWLATAALATCSRCGARSGPCCATILPSIRASKRAEELRTYCIPLT